MEYTEQKNGLETDVTLLQSLLFSSDGCKIQTYKMINSDCAMKLNLENDKLVMKIIRKQTCKMITQDYDKSVSKKQESGLKWLIIFLGKVCIPDRVLKSLE